MKALLALALVAALAAGCSGSPAGPVTPQKDAQGSYVIHMLTTNQFGPKDAKVPVGANVTWVHDGGAQHNVVDKGSAFTSDDLGDPLGPGQSYTHKFATAGTYHYHCAFHSGMEATLTVA
ncbi:MAG: cupredoxin domain-containing protein [Halobacteriales archaeon]|nr:cupredoxin domain-containing protein [Halobacteriales archaeon]